MATTITLELNPRQVEMLGQICDYVGPSIGDIVDVPFNPDDTTSFTDDWQNINDQISAARKTVDTLNKLYGIH